MIIFLIIKNLSYCHSSFSMEYFLCHKSSLSRSTGGDPPIYHKSWSNSDVTNVCPIFLKTDFYLFHFKLASRCLHHMSSSDNIHSFLHVNLICVKFWLSCTIMTLSLVNVSQKLSQLYWASEGGGCQSVCCSTS